MISALAVRDPDEEVQKTAIDALGSMAQGALNNPRARRELEAVAGTYSLGMSDELRARAQEHLQEVEKLLAEAAAAAKALDHLAQADTAYSQEAADRVQPLLERAEKFIRQVDSAAAPFMLRIFRKALAEEMGNVQSAIGGQDVGEIALAIERLQKKLDHVQSLPAVDVPAG